MEVSFFMLIHARTPAHARVYAHAHTHTHAHPCAGFLMAKTG